MRLLTVLLGSGAACAEIGIYLGETAPILSVLFNHTKLDAYLVVKYS